MTSSVRVVIIIPAKPWNGLRRTWVQVFLSHIFCLFGIAGNLAVF